MGFDTAGGGAGWRWRRPAPRWRIVREGSLYQRFRGKTPTKRRLLRGLTTNIAPLQAATSKHSESVEKVGERQWSADTRYGIQRQEKPLAIDFGCDRDSQDWDQLQVGVEFATTPLGPTALYRYTQRE